MGMLVRKQYTMPAPRGVEITERDGKRIACWRLRNGELRSAEVVDTKNGKLRVRGQSKYYMARFRDGSGQVIEVATGCTDRIAARNILSQLERRAELIRAGVMTESDGDVAGHAAQPLAKHLDAYLQHLRAKGGNRRRISMLRRRLERLIRECRFTRLNRMSAGAIERWLVEQIELGMAPATRNVYRESLVCFGNWCRRTNRLVQNPFGGLPRANQNVNRKHQRRALTEAELSRLLKVARLRPLAEFGRDVVSMAGDSKRSSKSRATWKRGPLTFDNIDAAAERGREALRNNPDWITRLERLGRERALIYKTLVLTGLRKGELASLTVGQLEFEGTVTYAALNPEDEKNRQGSSIPIRADLAGEISAWLGERLIELQRVARATGKPIPVRLSAREALFNVPSGLARILDRDLAAAGIPKRDERNRVVDVHALRVTFGSHLCAAGVPLRTAQVAMRHSKPELTANIYSDPKLIDVAGAIDALPALTIPTNAAKPGGPASNSKSRRRATS